VASIHIINGLGLTYQGLDEVWAAIAFSSEVDTGSR
jgi:hypothetical protein